MNCFFLQSNKIGHLKEIWIHLNRGALNMELGAEFKIIFQYHCFRKPQGSSPANLMTGAFLRIVLLCQVIHNSSKTNISGQDDSKSGTDGSIEDQDIRLKLEI